MPARDFRPAHLLPEQVATIIGLVSDTHFPQRCRQLPAALFDVLAGADVVLHAGDVGELSVLDELSCIAPVIAVHGNDDTVTAQRELPYQQVITAHGVRIFLWHSHYPDAEEERASRKSDDMIAKLGRSVAQAERTGAAVTVFGHWHIPLTYRQNGVVVVNPGAIASGNPITRQLHQTAALLFLDRGGMSHIVHVDLAQPDRPFDPGIDVQQGFAAALNRFSRSIMSPELMAELPRVRSQLTPAELGALREFVFELSHRCWAGELPLLDLQVFVTEMERTDTLPPALRARLQSLWETAPDQP
ncbi:MAG: YfcE family phosphodiesterase [Caldilineaceae bacterium]|nr:YfcE family phosphodiesterase [Caldilineaceae bacterium]